MPGTYAHLMSGTVTLTVQSQSRQGAFDALQAISEDDELLPDLTVDGIRLRGVTIQGGTGVVADSQTGALEGAGTYPMTADVMAVAYSDQGEVSEGAEWRALEAVMGLSASIPVTASVPCEGIVLGTLHLATDPHDEGLMEVDGVNAADMCANADCRKSTADGEGYNGECGDCADRSYAASLDSK